jgi:hypothetical protein
LAQRVVEELIVLRGDGDRVGENIDHAGQRGDVDGQGRHQDDDVAERSQKQPSLPSLLRNAMTHSCFERICLSRGTVTHEFDACHEALLPDVTDVRQSKEGLQ